MTKYIFKFYEDWVWPLNDDSWNRFIALNFDKRHSIILSDLLTMQYSNIYFRWVEEFRVWEKENKIKVYTRDNICIYLWSDENYIYVQKEDKIFYSKKEASMWEFIMYLLSNKKIGEMNLHIKQKN